MTLKMIQVGTGGVGEYWCREFLPPFIESGEIEVVAAVDVNPQALLNAKTHLGLRDEHCYTDVQQAMDQHPADFCTVVVPPAHHEAIVDQALAHDLHILSEKPIADTLAASLRIAAKVKQADKKMGVTMSHRFDQDKTTLRDAIQSGHYGALDYLVCRFTCNNRQFGSWGSNRHQIPDALLVEGAVHQLDFLADISQANCHSLYAQTWNPQWGEFDGDSQGMVTMTMENKVRIFYEGAKCNAIGLNGWQEDYIRAECEHATLILNRRTLEYFPHDANTPFGIEGQGIPIPLLEQSHWGHRWLIQQFIDWLGGGQAMATQVEANLQSMAMIFAGIDSARSGEAVKVQTLLNKASQVALRHE